MSPLYVAGLGCRRHSSLEALLQLLDHSLEQQQLSRSSLHALASSEHKRTEPALQQLADVLQIPVYFLPTAQLQAQEHRLTHHSSISQRMTGSSGVAEASALALILQLTGESGSLMGSRQQHAQATCALAALMPSESV